VFSPPLPYLALQDSLLKLILTEEILWTVNNSCWVLNRDSLRAVRQKKHQKLENFSNFLVKNAITLWMSQVYPSSNYLKMTIFPMIQLLLSQKSAVFLSAKIMIYSDVVVDSYATKYLSLPRVLKRTFTLMTMIRSQTMIDSIDRGFCHLCCQTLNLFQSEVPTVRD